MLSKESNIAGHPKARRDVIGGFDSLDLCYYCCDNNFCNHKDCEKGMSIITTSNSKAASALSLGNDKQFVVISM